MTKVKGFVPFVFFSQLFKSLGGKIQTADGQSLEGLPAYLQAVSNLFNDKADRDVKRAQAKKLLSEAGKIDAETEMARAEARKTNAETTTITLQNAKTMIELFGSHEVDTDSDKLDENVARLERELMSAEERYQRIEPILDRLGINPPMIESQESIVSLPVNREE
jgi:multidrug efflux pump subunit AcrA (membrane-fusion protein)